MKKEIKNSIALLLTLLSITTIIAQTAPASGLSAAYDQVIDSRFKADEPGGVVLIAQKGQVIYERAFGMAHLELNVKMEPGMVFQIGSMTKQFTAVCILQLAEQGKLDLHDPISKYIADAPAEWQKVTIENLLTHTSGISDQPGWQNFEIKQLTANAKTHSLAFTPGIKVAYNNVEYMLLGDIIAQASGMAYPDYLQKKILIPLGMDHTWYNNSGMIIPGRVPCYVKTRSGGYANINAGIMPSAAGALVTNCEDLLKWNQGLISGKIIKKESLQKAWVSFHLPDGKDTYFGYGWQTGGLVQGSPVIEHSGITAGYTTDALYMPQEDIYIVVLTNQRGILPEIIAAKLAAIAIGKPDLRHEISTSDDVLQTYTGVFMEDTVPRKISFSDHKLYYQRSGGPRMQMKPYAADKFFFDNTSVTGEFKKDGQQNVTRLLLFNDRHPAVPTDTLNKTDLLLTPN